MEKKIYIAVEYRRNTPEYLIQRIKSIVKNEGKIYDFLPDYPFTVSHEVYIYPVTIERVFVALHMYTTTNYVQFIQALKRIVRDNSDLFDGFHFSRQYNKIYLHLTEKYRE